MPYVKRLINSKRKWKMILWESKKMENDDVKKRDM